MQRHISLTNFMKHPVTPYNSIPRWSAKCIVTTTKWATFYALTVQNLTDADTCKPNALISF